MQTANHFNRLHGIARKQQFLQRERVEAQTGQRQPRQAIIAQPPFVTHQVVHFAGADVGIVDVGGVLARGLRERGGAVKYLRGWVHRQIAEPEMPGLPTHIQAQRLHRRR